LFDSARQCAPSVIILEDIDAIAPAGADAHLDEDEDDGDILEASETCAAYVLRAELDTLRLRRAAHRKSCASGQRLALASEAMVLIVATARDSDYVARWLLRPHRLSHTIRLEPELSRGEVGELLGRLLGRCGQDVSANMLERASATICNYGTGQPANIVGLCRVAAGQAIRRAVEAGVHPCVDVEDLQAALART